jgi:hypothetical protein
LNARAAALLLGLACVLSACVPDPRDYESTPVKLETPEGTVTCQLYTRERVLWDRAIDLPASMTVARADRYCQAEGQRLKDL